MLVVPALEHLVGLVEVEVGPDLELLVELLAIGRALDAAAAAVAGDAAALWLLFERPA